MERVRIGIIGFGHIGSQHAGNIKNNGIPNCELTAVADIDPQKLERAKSMMGDRLHTFESEETLIHSKTCDAVIVATPHYLHPSMSIMALEAGLHVLVEKPAGVYTKQVEAMNAVAAKSNCVFAIDFNQRTNPVYMKLKELVDEGELGQIKRTNWIITNWYRSQSYYDQGGWRATWDGEGGGVLLNQNPHNLDLWQWICGMPKRVKSNVYYGKHRNIEVEDDVTAFVEYENGATGTYITTVGDAPGTNRLEIDGDQGKIVVENDKLTFWRLRRKESEFNATYKGGLGHPECWECDIPIKGKYLAHRGIIENFCDAILTAKKLYAPGEEGIRGLEISNAIHLSSWLGGEWVELPIDPDQFAEKLQEHCKNKIIF